jgi:hypothetical protein
MSEPLTIPPAAAPLRLQSVPAWHGLRWIRQALALFMRRPLGFTGLFSASLLGVMLLLPMPLIGLQLVLMAAPWLGLGFMLATRRVLRGEPPLITVFIEPLRAPPPSRVRDLLLLGVSFTVGAVAMLLLADLLDGGAMERLLEQATSSKVDMRTLAMDPSILYATWLRIGLISLLAIPFWHAPPLVYWGGQPWTRAMVFSVVALWRNLGAFLVYGVGWVVVLMLVSTACTVLLSIPGMAQWMPVVSLLCMTLFLTALCVSTYFSFAACFTDEPLAPAPVP